MNTGVAGPALLLAVCLLSWAGVWAAHQRGGQSGRWIPLVGFAAAWCWFLTYHVDDALISYVYARNIALGLGPVAQVGAAPVEGFSNPLWVLLLVPTEWSGLGSLAGSKALQLGFSLATIWGLGQVVLRAGGSLVQAWMASVALATSGAFVVWTAAGLEVALFSFALLLAFALGQGGRPVWTGLAIGLCAWCRPEGLVPGLVAGCAGLWLARCSLRELLAACVVALLPCAVLVGLRWTLFGELLPNTYYAKVGHFGLGRLWRGAIYAVESMVIVGLPCWVLAAGPIRRAGWGRPALAAGSVVATGVLMAVLSGGDWMLHARFVAPYVPLLMVACVPPAVAAALAGRKLAIVAMFAAVACGTITLVHAAKYPTLPMDYGVRMARLYLAVSDEGCAGPASVAAPDVGALLYNRPALQVVDLGGLVEREAARSPSSFTASGSGPDGCVERSAERAKRQNEEAGCGEPGPQAQRGRVSPNAARGAWWPSALRARSPSMVHLHGSWAARTGLSDEALLGLGYRVVCRREPQNVQSATLWLHSRCAAPSRGTAASLLRHYCEHGVYDPWPGERGALFR